MQTSELSDLTAQPLRAVVINVRTELVTTRALASLNKYAPDCPVLLINCEPTPASEAFFSELANLWGFDILRWPARPHGLALDQLFLESNDEFIFLLDSDAEILNAGIFQQMVGSFQKGPPVFGAGFTHGPAWLGENEKVGDGNALYQERPWIPCVIFRVAHIKEGVKHGISFIDRTIREPDELSLIRFSSSDVDAVPVDLIFCDTGADIYQWNKVKKTRVFDGPDIALNFDVHHYHGVTRMFHAREQQNGTRLDEVSSEIKQRLLDNYNFDFDEFAAKATAGIIV